MEYLAEELNLYTEYEDDECQYPAHVHFDCPKCNMKNAPSDFYGNELGDNDDISCENCGANFKCSHNTNSDMILIEAN